MTFHTTTAVEILDKTVVPRYCECQCWESELCLCLGRNTFCTLTHELACLCLKEAQLLIIWKKLAKSSLVVSGDSILENHQKLKKISIITRKHIMSTVDSISAKLLYQLRRILLCPNQLCKNIHVRTTIIFPVWYAKQIFSLCIMYYFCSIYLTLFIRGLLLGTTKNI